MKKLYAKLQWCEDTAVISVEAWSKATVPTTSWEIHKRLDTDARKDTTTDVIRSVLIN